MASYNRVILVGNLTRDPELRYIASGSAVTDVGLAVNDRRKNSNGEWIVAWWASVCKCSAVVGKEDRRVVARRVPPPDKTVSPSIVRQPHPTMLIMSRPRHPPGTTTFRSS